MPLLRIWNSLLGRSSRPADQPEARRARDADQAAAGNAEHAAKQKRNSPSGEENATASRPTAPSPRPKPARRRLLAIGDRREAELRKRLKKAKVSKVLEIFVGDGSRTCSVLDTLAASQPGTPLEYAVIDPFETGASQGAGQTAEGVPVISVKEFHRRVRLQDARVRVFPGGTLSGLQRVACTIGPVDLILIGQSAEPWRTAEIEHWLTRLSGADTLVLVDDGERWHPWQPTTSQTDRIAA